jgi:gluconokinase
MGVAGSGKTTVASLFARETGAIFYEGDDYHSAESIEKMRNGIPLTDDDRAEWLQRLRQIIVQAVARNEFAVLTCSALKAKYRRQLQGNDEHVQFIYLKGSPESIAKRLGARRGHFMAPSLLANQLAIFEPPTDALTFDCELPPAQIVASLIQELEHS